MAKIVSHPRSAKSKKPPEQTVQGEVEKVTDGAETQNTTADEVDVNYIQFDDLPDADWPFG
jgi:hypothetical protein